MGDINVTNKLIEEGSATKRGLHQFRLDKFLLKNVICNLDVTADIYYVCKEIIKLY